MTIECGLTNKHALNNQVHLHIILAFLNFCKIKYTSHTYINYVGRRRGAS